MPQGLLGQQVVRGRDLIVTVCFDALHRVVRVIIELVQHLLVHFVVHRHGFATWEQASRSSVLGLLEPRVLTNLVNVITLVWVGAQDLGDEVCAVLGQHLRDFEFAR